MAAVKAVEEVVEDVAEEIAEEIATVRRIAPPRLNLNGTTKGQQIVVLSVTAFLGAVVGSGITYLVVRKRLSAKFDAKAQADIQEAKDFYQRMAKPPLETVSEEVTTSDVVEAADALQRYQTGRFKSPEYQERLAASLAAGSETSVDELLEQIREVTEEVDPTPETLKETNVFDNPTTPGEAVLSALLADRDPSKPYVVTKDEFYENEKSFDVRELIWYGGDQALADAGDDSPVAVETVGKENLLRFGYASDDPEIVYVCNEKYGVLMEVSFSDQKYAHVVAGLQHGGKLQHSADPIRKMRRGYDE